MSDGSTVHMIIGGETDEIIAEVLQAVEAGQIQPEETLQLLQQMGVPDEVLQRLRSRVTPLKIPPVAIDKYKIEENLRVLMREAYRIATFSKDPSTQNGAILVNDQGKVLATGCNRFPKGHEDTHDRWADRQHKYAVVVHAEEAVIWSALRKAINTEGLTMVCPWAACSMCARAILEAGIKRVVVHKDAMELDLPSVEGRKQWSDSIALAKAMLAEAGVEYVELSGKLNAAAVLHSGKRWNP